MVQEDTALKGPLNNFHLPSSIYRIANITSPQTPPISVTDRWSRAHIVLEAISGRLPPWTIDGRQAAYPSSRSLDIRRLDQRSLFLLLQLLQPSAKDKEL